VAGGIGSRRQPGIHTPKPIRRSPCVTVAGAVGDAATAPLGTGSAQGNHGVLEQFLDVRCPSDAAAKRVPDEITRVLEHIAANPARDWSVRELAALVGVSSSGFRAQFRGVMNESTHAYLQRARLDLARELLADENLRVKDVAEKLHFSSEYYFSHFFRQHTGVSPTEFRRHLELER